MSAPQEEEVISSPLSSAPSSIDDLDDFQFVELVAMPEQERAPSLLEGLPPFNPDSHPAAATTDSRPSRSQSSGSVKVQAKGSEEEDGAYITAQTTEAHFTTHIEIPPEVEEEQPLNDLATQRPVTPGASPEPPTSRNGRKRKAPTAASAGKDRAATAKKARIAKKWEVPFVFTDSKSPLINVNLRAILLHPKAWDVLPPADQEELRAMLEHDRPASLSASPSPPSKNGKSDENSPPAKVVTRPNLTYLRSDDSFRYDCARYTENVEEGKHDPDWLEESWVAHLRRKRGDFKEYLRGKLERDWDVKVPVVVEEEDEAEMVEVVEAEEMKSAEDGKIKHAQEENSAEGEKKKTDEEPAENGEPTKGSPVSSSVGETQFTDLKLEVAPAGENGDVLAPDPGTDSTGPVPDNGKKQVAKVENTGDDEVDFVA